jgi:hypothetical protein
MIYSRWVFELKIIKFLNYKNYKIFGRYNYMLKGGYKSC